MSDSHQNPGLVLITSTFLRVKERVAEERDRLSLRWWWREQLTSREKYSSYAVFFALPSDTELIRYLRDFGKEADMISGQNCMVITISKEEGNIPISDQEAWEGILSEHTSSAFLIRLADLFGIDFTDFPCLVIFEDIKSYQYTYISLKDLQAEAIADVARTVFSILRKADYENSQALNVLNEYLRQESQKKVGRTLVGQIRHLAGKTFETAIEALFKSLMD